nr:DUF3592 domain-containing protein [uncultured Holophaga sp.]
MKKPLKLFGMIFSLVGVALLLLAGALAWHEHSFLKGAIETQGQVVDMIQSHSNGKEMSSPIFEFSLKDGTLVRGRSSVASYPPAY